MITGKVQRQIRFLWPVPLASPLGPMAAKVRFYSCGGPCLQAERRKGTQSQESMAAPSDGQLNPPNYRLCK
jgi:hypothetical protein